MSYYFSEKQDSKPGVKKIKAFLRNQEFEFYTASGIFSKDKVDKGTELLVNSVYIESGWKVLDLGCGYGVVGIVIKKTFPGADVTLVDVNLRALKITRKNLKLNKVEAETVSSNLYENIRGKFNTIIINPPQKAGKDICFAMILGAKHHLLPNGLLQIVARHNKGGKTLSLKMEEAFGNVKPIGKKSGYHVYLSRLSQSPAV